jgi:hypothetical protein
MQKNVLFVYCFLPRCYDRLLELCKNRNAQFDVFRTLSRAISTSLTLVGEALYCCQDRCVNSGNNDYTFEVGCVLSPSQ